MEEIADGDEVERKVVEKVGIVPPLDDDGKDIVLDISETVSVNVESKLVLEVMETEDSDGGAATEVDDTEVMSLVAVFSDEEEFGVMVSEEEEETVSVDMLDTAGSVAEDTSEGVYVGDEVKEIVAVVSATEVGKGCETVGDPDKAFPVVVELIDVSVCVDVVVIDERLLLEELPDSEVVAGVVVGDREFDVTFSREDVVSAGSVGRDAPVGVDAVSVTEVVEGSNVEDPVTGTDVDRGFPVFVSEDVGEEIGTPKLPVEGLPSSELVADMVTDERPDLTVSAEDVPSAGSVEEDTPGKVDTGVVDVFVLSVTEMGEGFEIGDVVTTVEVDGALPVVSGDEVDEGVRGPEGEEPVETEGPAPVLAVLVLELPWVDCSKLLLEGRAEVGYVVVSVPGGDSG
ncbi:hypothetical protein F5876DRAFT_66582 [Lentinula aff. lateritia]|uniref:Uncharacterized protein n=1 Tax=Lentinula aff. lateritia TaxID=2804960 RepID=A0ACC1TX06_9AGAR|nr:hypothetical protein F5876DRAFT_66582 [Lentinula aff. lateritia]